MVAAPALAIALAIAVFPSICLASFINGADQSIPFDNKIALSTEMVTAWVSSSDRKGTGDILHSCTLTILLCIFTVLHLNIPTHKDKAWKQYLRKVRWIFVALIAPEIVMYTAFTRFQQIGTLCSVLKSLTPEEIDSRQVGEQSRIFNEIPTVSLAYGFFAAMGGFVVDVSEYCDHPDRLTLDTEVVT